MSPIYVPGKVILQSQASNDPLLDLNTQPSLDLQFATSKTLNDRVSGLPLVDHQRDVSSGKSAGTYVDSTGVIRTSKANLLTYSSVDTPGWAAAGTLPTVIWNGFSDPSGLNEAAKITFANSSNSQIQQSVSTFASGVTYTYSLYVRTLSGTQDFLLFRFDGADYSQQFTATTSWQRFQWTFAGAGGLAPSVRVRCVSPVGGEVLFVWGAQLEEGSTASPYIKTTNLPSAAPRFDHDPTTGESLGLLIEEGRTNLITYSEDLSQWTSIDNATLSTAISTPGSTAASRLTSTTSSTWARAWAPLYSGSGADTVGSVYLRGDTPFTASLRIRYDNVQVSIQNVNVTTDWQRFSLNATGSFTGGADLMVFLNADGVSGTSVSGRTLDIWGAQLEAGDFPTSYIPTSGSTVPRAADVASITGSNFSRWYNQGEGTISFRVKSPTNPVQYPVVIDDSTNNNRHLFAISNSYQYQIRVSGSTEAQMDAGSVLSPFNSIAGGYKTNNTAVALNGSVNVDNIASIPTCNRLSIYRYSGVTFNGHISRLTYYPYRLPDATLQEITS